MFNPQPKFEYLRSEKHLNVIRSLPCSNCGNPPRSQAAHSNMGIHGKGKGIKASDEFTIPLCHYCHRKYDSSDHRDSSEIFFMELIRCTARLLNVTNRLSPDAERLLIERGVL